MGANWKAAMTITLDNNSAVRKLREQNKAMDESGKAAARARDSMGRFIKSADGLSGVASKMRSVQGASGTMGRGLALGSGRLADIAGAASLAGLALKGVTTVAQAGAAIFKSGMKLENLTLALDSVNMDAESTSTQLEKLAELAALPGLDMDSAVQGSVALQAIGMSAAQSREHLKEWANMVASAGGSVDDFKGVMTAVRQIGGRRDGGVQQEDINQILERAGRFASIVPKLEAFKGDSKKWLAGAVTELGKLDRVAAGSQVKVDAIKDSFEALKAEASSGLGIKMIGDTAMGFGADLMSALNPSSKGTFKDAFMNVSGNMQASAPGWLKKLTGLEGAGPKSADEAKRAQRRKDYEAGERKLIERKIDLTVRHFSLQEEEAKKLFSHQKSQLEMEYDIAKARAAGDMQRTRDLEDQLELLKNVKKIALDLGVSEELVREKLAQQNALRRDAQDIAGRRTAADANADNDIADLRARGKHRRADALEDERLKRQRIEQLTGDNVSAEDANAIAERESRRRRESAREARTGSRRISGADFKTGFAGIDGMNNWRDSLTPDIKNLARVTPDGGAANKSRVDRLAAQPAAQARSRAAEAGGGLNEHFARFAKQQQITNTKLDQIQQNTAESARKPQ